MDVLAGWLMDEVPAEVTLQELHTAAELLLARLWGPVPKGVVLGTHSACGIGGGVLQADQLSALEDVDSAMTSAELLVAPKDQWKAAKHRGAAETQAWLAEKFWPAASLIERAVLGVGRARRGSGRGESFA